MKPLKPVMAALLAAASATFASPGISRAEIVDRSQVPAPATPVSVHAKKGPDCPTDGSQTDPINEIGCLIKAHPDQANKDIGDRLVSWVSGGVTQGDKKGRQYLVESLKQDQAFMKSVSSALRQWPEATEKQGNPNTVATLYFVIGPDAGELPTWARTPLLVKNFKTDLPFRGRLEDALVSLGWAGNRQIGQTVASDNLAAFLLSATESLEKVFGDGRPKWQIEKSVGDNDTTKPEPGTGKEKAERATVTGVGFDHEYLYVQGAKSGPINKPGEGFRRLSMKVYTVKDPDSDRLVSKLGIVDITEGDPGNTPTLPVFIDPTPGEHDVVLSSKWDKVAQKMIPSGRHYTVTVDGEGKITLARKGVSVQDARDGNGAIVTSRYELLGLRDEQIRNSGTVAIGGENFYAYGQGGADGSILFFSQKQMDGAGKDGNVKPEMMGMVAKAGDNDFNGRANPASPKPNLGSFGGKEWHLEHNDLTHCWEVVVGHGDKKEDKDKDKAAKDKAAKDKTKPDTGGENPPTTGGEPPDSKTPGTLQDVIDALGAIDTKGQPSWDEDNEANNGFTDDMDKKVRIMSRMEKGHKKFLVLFDPSLKVNNNQLPVGLSGDYVEAMYGVGEYLMYLGSTSGAVYYDLENFIRFFSNTPGTQQSGTFTLDKGMSEVSSLPVLEHILGFFQLDPKDIKKIMARAKSHSTTPPFKINGTLGEKGTITLTSNKNTWQIWPDDKDLGQILKNEHEGLQGLVGQGTAVQITGGPVPGDFPAEFALGGTRSANRVKMENGAAMYVGVEEQYNGDKLEENQVYSVMINYVKNGYPSRSNARVVFGGRGRLPLPADYHLQGYAGVEFGDMPQLMNLYGSNAKGGAMVMFRTTMPDAQGGNNVKNKTDNCLGPVIWWGDVSKEEAQAACLDSARVH
ncbi:MAG: hypothetical protein ACHQ49_01585 [Elusimicrobiota bacterium]